MEILQAVGRRPARNPSLKRNFPKNAVAAAMHWTASACTASARPFQLIRPPASEISKSLCTNRISQNDSKYGLWRRGAPPPQGMKTGASGEMLEMPVRRYRPSAGMAHLARQVRWPGRVDGNQRLRLLLRSGKPARERPFFLSSVLRPPAGGPNVRDGIPPLLRNGYSQRHCCGLCGPG
jgi:hypothetical protein